MGGSGLTPKKKENRPKIVLYWYYSYVEVVSIPYFVYIHTLLEVVSHYDLSILSMSVMGFQKSFWHIWWVVG